MKSPEHVASVVSDPKLVEERRGGILDAAVKLFAENGYYVTTIQQIAKASGVSIGLIYQYFGDKDDILFLSLKRVLDRYETEIPARLEGVSHPVDRLCTAVWAYCSIVDELRQVAVLTYRSTGSLRADRRALIQQAELRTNDARALRPGRLRAGRHPAADRAVPHDEGQGRPGDVAPAQRRFFRTAGARIRGLRQGRWRRTHWEEVRHHGE